MNPEIYVIISAALGLILFPLGGTQISETIPGKKWLRRELLPILWALFALVAGFEWWRCVGVAMAFDIVFRLPYGDDTPKWWRFFVFMIYPLPSLFLGFNIWQFFAGALCFGLWALSNWKPTAKAFEWVISCLLIGAVLGITVGQLITQTTTRS